MACSSCQSVAGEAEQMASVVHEFMHVLAAYQRSSSLLCTHKIDCQQENKPRKYCPRKPLTQGYCGGRAGRCECGVRHIGPPGIARPVRASNDHEVRVWLPTHKAEYSGATAPDSHRLPYFGKPFAE